MKLVVSDGHKGIRKAVDKSFLGASWQMGHVHLIRAVPSHFAYKIRYHMVRTAPWIDMLIPQLNAYDIGSQNPVQSSDLGIKILCSRLISFSQDRHHEIQQNSQYPVLIV